MSTSVKPTVIFWILAAVFLAWNLLGCALYWMDATMSDAAYAEMYGEAMVPLRAAYPAWAMSGYAIGVWGGLMAAVTFLLRKRWAIWLFVLSFIGALISNIWTVTSPIVKEAAGGTHWVMPLVITLIGLFEIWYSRKKAGEGVLS